MADTQPGGQTYTPKTENTRPDDELTIGEFIGRHSMSGDEERDLNNNQIAEQTGLNVSEVVQIQRELGHKLPEGAN